MNSIGVFILTLLVCSKGFAEGGWSSAGDSRPRDVPPVYGKALGNEPFGSSDIDPICQEYIAKKIKSQIDDRLGKRLYEPLKSCEKNFWSKRKLPWGVLGKFSEPPLTLKWFFSIFLNPIVNLSPSYDQQGRMSGSVLSLDFNTIVDGGGLFESYGLGVARLFSKECVKELRSSINMLIPEYGPGRKIISTSPDYESSQLAVDISSCTQRTLKSSQEQYKLTCLDSNYETSSLVVAYKDQMIESENGLESVTKYFTGSSQGKSQNPISWWMNKKDRPLSDEEICATAPRMGILPDGKGSSRFKIMRIGLEIDPRTYQNTPRGEAERNRDIYLMSNYNSFKYSLATWNQANFPNPYETLPRVYVKGQGDSGSFASPEKVKCPVGSKKEGGNCYVEISDSFPKKLPPSKEDTTVENIVDFAPYELVDPSSLVVNSEFEIELPERKVECAPRTITQGDSRCDQMMGSQCWSPIDNKSQKSELSYLKALRDLLEEKKKLQQRNLELLRAKK